MSSIKNCERYKRWKKEQELLKDPKKQEIKKRKKEITDCIEEEKKTVRKTTTNIRYRKCKEKGKIKRKETKGVIFKPKLVSSIDLLLKRIQPSLKVRYEMINHRHFNCFIENGIAQKETMIRQEKKRIAKKDFKKKKLKRKKKLSKEEKVVELEIKSKKKTATADVEREDAIVGEIIENEIKNDENKVQRKKIIKKDKFWCKKVKKKTESESEVSECESICSFDSEICLKRLALTLEDKKKIEQNRKSLQTSSNQYNS